MALLCKICAIHIKIHKLLLFLNDLYIESTLLDFFEEYRSNKAAEKLKELVATSTSVIRDGKQIDIPLFLYSNGHDSDPEFHKSMKILLRFRKAEVLFKATRCRSLTLIKRVFLQTCRASAGALR